MSDAPAGGGFVAGLAARHDLAAQTLRSAFPAPDPSFAPRGATAFVGSPRHFAPQPPAPKHFSPADRAANPTEGWNPLDPNASTAGFIDPFAAAREAGFTDGMAAARAALDEAGERDRALLEGLLGEIAAGRALDRDAIARQLRQTVLLLVGKLVGEVGVSPDLLAGRIETAIDYLADAAESALLRVHPDDVALLEGRLPKTVFAIGDAGIARGSFVLESASTMVEDGPALWLDQLSEAIDRVAVPKD